MFPRMCIHEPWRNMDVKTFAICRPGSVRHVEPAPMGKRVPGGRLSVSSPGIRPRSQMDMASGQGEPAPWIRSHAPRLSAIRTKVT